MVADIGRNRVHGRLTALALCLLGVSILACASGPEVPCDEAKQQAYTDLHGLHENRSAALAQWQARAATASRKDAEGVQALVTSANSQVQAAARARDAFMAEGFSEIAASAVRSGIEELAGGEKISLSQQRALILRNEELRKATAAAQTALASCRSGDDPWPLGVAVQRAVASEPAMKAEVSGLAERAVDALRTNDPAKWLDVSAAGTCQLVVGQRGVTTPDTLRDEGDGERIKEAFESCRTEIDFAAAKVVEVEDAPFIAALEPCEVQEIREIKVKLDVAGTSKTLQLRDALLIGDKLAFGDPPWCR